MVLRAVRGGAVRHVGLGLEFGLDLEKPDLVSSTSPCSSVCCAGRRCSYESALCGRPDPAGWWLRALPRPSHPTPLPVSEWSAGSPAAHGCGCSPRATCAYSSLRNRSWARLRSPKKHSRTTEFVKEKS